MTKKTLCTLAAGLFLALFSLSPAPAAAPAAGPVKIGVVDLEKVINNTKEGKAALAAIKEQIGPKQEKLEAMAKELKELEGKIQSPVVSDSAKAGFKKEFQEKYQEFMETQNRFETEFTKVRRDAQNKLLTGVKKVVVDIAAREQFTLILERSAGGVVFAQETLDLTDRVIKAYDEKAPAGGKP